MSNLEKIDKMAKSNPELLEKLATESKRLADSGEKDIRKISAEAIKAVYGVDLTDEELDQVADSAAKASAKPSAKLNLDELDNVAGGGRSFGDKVSMVTTVCAINGALIGGAVGSAVPLVGTAVGATAGGTIGAVVGVASAAIDYVVNND